MMRATYGDDEGYGSAYLFRVVELGWGSRLGGGLPTAGVGEGV